MPKSEVGRCF